MLIETSSILFKHLLSKDPHPFNSERFIEHNCHKVDKVIRLIECEKKTELGLVAGIIDGVIKSHFSAPYGGFHFQHKYLYTSAIDNFINKLKEYVRINKYKKIEITIPPNLYHPSMNSKFINSLHRHGFIIKDLDITNWINLKNFKGEYSYRSSRTYFRQALKNNLSFDPVDKKNIQKQMFDLIIENRKRNNRPIYMTFEELQQMKKIWPTDYFVVTDSEASIVASAILYRAHESIAYAVFWGDNEKGRPLRAMDFLLFNLWMHYKELGFEYIDLGISTEHGIPNENLLRFKETHDCDSSIRYSFYWKPEKNI